MKKDFSLNSIEPSPATGVSRHTYSSQIAAADRETMAELAVITPLRDVRSASITCLDEAGDVLRRHDLLLRAGRIERSILHFPTRTRQVRVVLGLVEGTAPERLETRLSFPGRLGGLLRLALFVWRVNRVRGVSAPRLVMEKMQQLHRLGLRNLLTAPVSHVDFREIGGLDYQTWLSRSTEYQLREGVFDGGSMSALAVFIDATARPEHLSESLHALAKLGCGPLTVRVFGDFTGKAADELAAASPVPLSCAGPGQFEPVVRSALKGTDWAWFLRAGDVIRPHAPYVLDRLIAGGHHGPLCYFDHDYVSDGVRHSPAFKPDWNREFYLHVDYIRRALLVSSDYLAGQPMPASPDQIHERLLLGALQSGVRPRHVPEMLLSLPVDSDAERGPAGDVERKQRISRFLTASGVRHSWRTGIAGVSADYLDYSRGFGGSLPQVALIIPTRDQLRLIRQCVHSIREVTDYPAFEIVIVDNGSRDRKALRFLDECRRLDGCRVLSYDQPFNFSAINNFAVECVEAELVCLVNNDIKAFRPDWLANMAAYFARPDIGAVGAKLLYRNGRVQHAGIICGLGNVAGHAHRFYDAADEGYLRRLQVPNEFSAVTGACLMTRRSLYRELGGLNATELAVAYNDVDFCLRLRRGGYRIVYAPQAELFHLESKSRGSEDTAEKKERYARETEYMWHSWREQLLRDPCYNPNLTRVREDFSVNPSAAGPTHEEETVSVDS